MTFPIPTLIRKMIAKKPSFFGSKNKYVTSSIFAKIGQKLKFPGLNANRLGILLRAQRGMAFLILTLFRQNT